MLKKPVEAVLFDMDGLLIDTEAVYIDAYGAAAQAMGVEMSLALCHSMIGVPSRECKAMIQDHFGSRLQARPLRRPFLPARQPTARRPRPGQAGRRGDSGVPRRPRPAAGHRHVIGHPVGAAPSRQRRAAGPLQGDRHALRRRARQAASRCLSRSGAAAGRGARALHRLRGFQCRPHRRPCRRHDGDHGARHRAAVARGFAPSA